MTAERPRPLNVPKRSTRVLQDALLSTKPCDIGGNPYWRTQTAHSQKQTPRTFHRTNREKKVKKTSPRVRSATKLKKDKDAILARHECESALEWLRRWFTHQGWKPWSFQEQTWAAFAQGQSGLVCVPTGSGKTYAAFLGPLAEIIERPLQGVRIVYVTPLRAVSRDIEHALSRPIEALGLTLRVELRTGDTSTHQRAKQKLQQPEVLITTPESLSLLLTEPKAAEFFKNVCAVILDEWHDLLGTKRGTQTELALSRIRAFAPQVRIWALSATLNNLEEAASAAVGMGVQPKVIRADVERPILLETLLPTKLEQFSWSEHLGLQLVPEVIRSVKKSKTTLLFTNTRSQAERWFMALNQACPEWSEHIALHHGSLEREERERVEQGLKVGSLRLVICTSSLDLGVDFASVDLVIQIGSPKSIARVLQRAGRASHKPGLPCTIVFVPNHALELIEITAIRDAIASHNVESRHPLRKPLDVLAQHLVTCAIGGGFSKSDLLKEIQSTVSYASLSQEEFDWALSFVHEGGRTLKAYADYHKVVVNSDGQYVVSNSKIARLHKLTVGTIVSESMVNVRLLGGAQLGTVEEGFIAQLTPGDRFVFAGKTLEFARIDEMTAYVRPASRSTTQTPRWMGNRQPFSEILTHSIGRVLSRIEKKCSQQNCVQTAMADESIEIQTMSPIVEAQAKVSKVPTLETLLIEICSSEEGQHLFVYPFQGHLVHEGLASLLARRMSHIQPATLSISVNEYGFEIFCAESFPFVKMLEELSLFSTENLETEIRASINETELIKRQFREIARVAGLIFHGYPGAPKTLRQVQTSSNLLFEVFRRYDPESLLLEQARREVTDRYFELARIKACLTQLYQRQWQSVVTSKPSPFAFPLIVERVSTTVSSESLLERMARMKAQWS